MILQKYTFFFFQADKDHFVAEMPAFAHPGEAVSHWGASVLDEVLERGWKRCRWRLGSPSAPGGPGCPGTGRTLGHPASPSSFHFSLHSKHGNPRKGKGTNSYEDLLCARHWTMCFIHVTFPSLILWFQALELECVQILALLFPSWMTLGRLFNLSGP